MVCRFTFDISNQKNSLFVRTCYDLFLEIHTHGGYLPFNETIFNQSTKNTGFSYTRITNYDDFCLLGAILKNRRWFTSCVHVFWNLNTNWSCYWQAWLVELAWCNSNTTLWDSAFMSHQRLYILRVKWCWYFFKAHEK